ncbi:MAG: TMEM43 family protein [Rhodanobacter sp.]
MHVLLAMRALLLNLLGATLMLAGVSLAAVTARAVLQFEAVAAQHGGQVVDLGGNAVPQAGQMVRVVGTPRVVEPALDAEFKLSVDTPVLSRHVEMFEWHEVQLGENVQYELDWADHTINARNFRDPQNHANPPGFLVRDRRFEAGLVQIGGFRLSSVILRALPGTAPVAPDANSLPANLAASFVRQGNYLQTSVRADSPQLGDLRVSWEKIPLRAVTVVARLDGDRLVPAEGAADGQGYQVAIGNVRLRELFPDLPSAPEATKLKRVLSVLLAMLGAFVLLSVRRHAMIAAAESALRKQLRGDLVLAIGLGALAVGAVTATIWAGHNMRMTMFWAGLALLGTLVSVWQWHRRA